MYSSIIASVRMRAAGALAMLLTLPAPSMATDNHADMLLQTDLKQMVIRIEQANPMPPGGCTSSHRWHTTYGGCRRQETRSEAGQCPAGWSGSRVRSRNVYILQANANDVAAEQWGAWVDTCVAPSPPTPDPPPSGATRLSGYVDTIIARARGGETGDWSNRSGLSGNIARSMQVSNGSAYGVTIHRPSALLNCVYASGTTPTSGDTTATAWYGEMMSPGQSISKGGAGSCTLSGGGQSATVFGSCDSTSGGDADQCTSASRTVRITDTTDCTVSTQTLQNGRVTGNSTFNLC